MSTYKHGIATKSSGAVGITQSKTTYSAQVIIGTLPINTLKNPKDAVNSIILLENSEDMDNLVGKTNEIEKYTAMQGVYASLKVHKVAPVVVINVLDPDKSQHTQAVVGKEYDVVNKMVVIEDTGVLLDKVVVSENETTYKADDDYVASINSEGYLVIALTNDGAASSLQKLNISYVKLNPDGVTAEDIIGGIDENGVRSGIELLDEVFITSIQELFRRLLLHLFSVRKRKLRRHLKLRYGLLEVCTMQRHMLILTVQKVVQSMYLMLPKLKKRMFLRVNLLMPAGLW